MMPKSVICILLLALSAPGFSQTDPVLFSIDGEEVRYEEFAYVYQKNNSLRNNTQTEADVQEYLELYINFKLKVHEARRLGYDTTQAFKEEFNSYCDQLARPFLTEESYKDSLIHQAYNRLQEIISANHILIQMPADEVDTIKYYQKINEVHNMAVAGSDFEKLAKAYSQEPNAKITGGELGYFTSMQMVYPFENVAYSTRIGQVSKPFRTSFGFHILKVNDRKVNPGKVEVSHIMLRFRENTNLQDSVSLEERIKDLHKQLIADPNRWDSLCMNFSDDRRTSSLGGKLAPFGVGEIIPSFSREAFSLANSGDISVPFTTSFGWHIIRLEKMIPLPSFEEMETDLKRRVLKGDRLDAGRATSLKYLQGKYNYQEITTQTDIIFNLTNNKLLDFSQIQDSELSKDLFRVRSENYNAFGFKDYLHERYAPNKFSDSTFVIKTREVFNDYILNLLVEFEKSDVYRNNEDYRRLITEYEEGMLLFSIMEDEVWNKASIDTVGLRNFYIANTDRYVVSDSAKLLVFNIDPAMQAIELDVLHQQQSLENRPGEHMWVNLSKWSATGYDDVFLQTDSDSIRAGIVLEYSDKRQQAFTEVKGRVISEYQVQLERDWIKQLKRDYTVNKNKRGIEIAVEQLAK